MSNEFYYDSKAVSFSERETFNNTILLLTMVRSQYYYIVGFSRPKSMIEIAFDFESGLHGLITESLTLHFGESEEYLVMRCQLKNISQRLHFQEDTIFKGRGEVIRCGDNLKYEYMIPKDRLIPMSIEKMNTFILDAKKEIIYFLEQQYSKLEKVKVKI